MEVASHAPRIFGDVRIPLSRVWGIVESDRYPCVLPRETPTREDELLGAQVAELVDDGSTIQLGFGGTIDALAQSSCAANRGWASIRSPSLTRRWS